MFTHKILSLPFIHTREDKQYVVVRREYKTGKLIIISRAYKEFYQARNYLKGWKEALSFNSKNNLWEKS